MWKQGPQNAYESLSDAGIEPRMLGRLGFSKGIIKPFGSAIGYLPESLLPIAVVYVNIALFVVSDHFLSPSYHGLSEEAADTRDRSQGQMLTQPPVAHTGLPLDPASQNHLPASSFAIPLQVRRFLAQGNSGDAILISTSRYVAD
jgi:hypothetical protein